MKNKLSKERIDLVEISLHSTYEKGLLYLASALPHYKDLHFLRSQSTLDGTFCILCIFKKYELQKHD